MPKRMLIDASHPEETRVVVLDGQRVDEFDFEAASKRPLKGNIYLAKVTRVEPSLQAAFVEYGGNRQGFLAFSEIHPDYYQIPVADRQALIAEQQEEVRRRGDDEFETVATGTSPATDAELEAREDDFDVSEGQPETDDHPAASVIESGFDVGQIRASVTPAQGQASEAIPIGALADEESEEGIVDQQTLAEAAIEEAETEDVWSNDSGVQENSAGAEADAENGNTAEDRSEPAPATGAAQRPAQPLRNQRPSQRWVRRRHYKIQEVIKRKQIMLVQVVKEERGTKGAALTTYLSLAGRYCVLMPNTPRGGGISRKITNAVDRNRLKAAAATLELPEGMGLIIRTAGANRTKLEIKRDYEYLLRLWDQIRELTLQSNAPACVYEEGDIIKRAIRDLYNKDVSEIFVEGEDGYKNAKDFMRMLMPSHAKNVKLYRDSVPIFQKHHIEAQLDAMFQPAVTLKSGGYIVINQTEALVSIDVNSGRATREHSIEETAHKTNLEAADEVARQLRLRDLAGLIVIDFIDMEDSRNDRDVEKRLRDAVKHDRARVQIGKISQFGLLEMSRQRLRAGVVAGSTVPCPHCGGQGIVRSVESTALRVVRALDEEGQRGRTAAVTVRVANDVALYTLNQKRRELARIETDYGMTIAFEPNEKLMAGSFDLERTAQRTQPLPLKVPVSADAAMAMPADMSEPIEEDIEELPAEVHPGNGGQPQGTSGTGKKRRRRRRGRGGRSAEAPSVTRTSAHEHSQALEGDNQSVPPMASDPLPSTTHPAGNGQQPDPTGSSRRRRRRRRKPRGDAPGALADAPRSADPGRAHTGESARHHHAAAPLADAVTPNAPSDPVWSLGSDRAEAAAAVAHEPVGQMYYRREQTLDAREAAPVSAAQELETEAVSSASTRAVGDVEPELVQQSGKVGAPQRRGWWQRPFKKT